VSIPVEEVGTGVGYLDLGSTYLAGTYCGRESSSGDERAKRFAARGSEGGEDSGSKAGSSAGLFTPAMGGGRLRGGPREGESMAADVDAYRTSAMRN
jgi:hypothetical protein